MPLNNFGIIDTSGTGILARSAQPDKIAAVALKRAGFDTLYKVNTDSEYSDKLEVANWTNMSGLISVGSLEGIGNLPQSVSAVILNPYPPLIKIPAKDTIVATVLQVKQLMDRGRKIVVHCTHGTDRTGLVIGAYRIIVNSWTFEEVQAERDVFGANAIRDIVDAEIVEFLKQLKV